MAATRHGTSTKTTATGLLRLGAQGATIASASSITITDSFHEITGSTTINTINGGVAGQVLWLYRPTGATWAIGSGGNVKAGSGTATERVVILSTPNGTTWYGQGTDVSVASANTDISVAESSGIYTLTFNPANVTLDELTGPLAITKGGTGQTAKAAAFDALAPTTTRGDIIYHGASDNDRLAVGTSGYYLTSNGTDPAWTASPIPITDSTAIVKGSADATKLVRIEADGLTTGTTRVITMPNSNTTLPIFSQVVTFSGPTAARTYTLTDANATLAILGANTFTGAQAFNSTVQVGSTGVALTSILSGSSTTDVGSVAAGASTTFAITVTGAAVGDPVFISYPNTSSTTDVIHTAFVNGTNSVSVQVDNLHGSSSWAPGSFTYKAVVFKF